jgi:isopentenyldiphosphate isomerase
MDERGQILDLVNDKNEVIGEVSRGDMVKMGYNNPDGYIRFANGFIAKKSGEIWVPVRGRHKKIAPGGYDFSVAVHVLSGETYEHAITRAFDEEAGMKVDKFMLNRLGVTPPTKDKPSFDTVFVLYEYDGEDPNYAKEQFESCQWMKPEELVKLISSKPARASLLPALELLIEFIDKYKD